MRTVGQSGGGGGPGMLEGKLAVSGVEGQHYELEAAVDGGKLVYVLIPAGDEVEKALAACVGMRVCVTGSVHQGPSIFMRGSVFRVTGVHTR